MGYTAWAAAWLGLGISRDDPVELAGAAFIGLIALTAFWRLRFASRNTNLDWFFSGYWRVWLLMLPVTIIVELVMLPVTVTRFIRNRIGTSKQAV